MVAWWVPLVIFLGTVGIAWIIYLLTRGDTKDQTKDLDKHADARTEKQTKEIVAHFDRAQSRAAVEVQPVLRAAGMDEEKIAATATSAAGKSAKVFAETLGVIAKQYTSQELATGLMFKVPKDMPEATVSLDLEHPGRAMNSGSVIETFKPDKGDSHH